MSIRKSIILGLLAAFLAGLFAADGTGSRRAE